MTSAPAAKAYYRVCLDCGAVKANPVPSPRCCRCGQIARNGGIKRKTFTECEVCGIPKEGRSIFAPKCRECALRMNQNAIRAAKEFQVAQATGHETEREQQARACALRLAAEIGPRINLGIRGEK